MTDVLDTYGNIGGAPFLNALRTRERRIVLKVERTTYDREWLQNMIADLDGPTIYEQMMEERKRRNGNSKEEDGGEQEAGTSPKGDCSGGNKGKGSKAKPGRGSQANRKRPSGKGTARQGNRVAR